MRARFRYFSFVIGWLSIATVACALPPPSNLRARLHRDETTRARARATPTPTPAPDYSGGTTVQTERPSTIVVIDAGHGGHDRGGIPGQRVAEKTMTLDVAQRLRTILAANGYRTIMTRDSDVFVPLPTRVAIANSYRNAIFVCIHFNSATRRGANGIETYFYGGQSLPLASAIHYYVSRAAPSLNRGVRRRGYYVLRRTAVPSVLVECGFLTNPTEAQYAQSVNYRQTLAEQIARGIRSRTLVASSSGTRVASVETAPPLQPFIDQTRVRDRDISGSRHRTRKRSKSTKTTAVHREKSSDDESGGSTTVKRKSTAKKSED
jgi:N-acetylmuramoyl-L-alanine amidase